MYNTGIEYDRKDGFGNQGYQGLVMGVELPQSVIEPNFPGTGYFGSNIYAQGGGAGSGSGTDTVIQSGQHVKTCRQLLADAIPVAKKYNTGAVGTLGTRVKNLLRISRNLR